MSPSSSWAVYEAVSVSLVVGADGSMVTVSTTGGAFTVMVTVAGGDGVLPCKTW